MSCERYQDWFSPYLDGELNGADRRALDRHLERCQACATELETLRGSVDLVRGLLPEEPPAELRPRILAAIEAERRSPWRRLVALLRLPRPAPGWSLAATGLAAALAVGLFVGRPAPSGGPSPVPEAPPTVVTRPAPPVESAERETAPPPAATPTKQVARAPRLVSSGRATPARAASSSAAPIEVARAPRRALPPRDREREAREQVELNEPTRAVPTVTPRRAAPSTLPASGPSSAETAETPRLAPLPSVASAADSDLDEPATMMAAMPRYSGNSNSGPETISGESDALASLRRRLAEQRRAMPIPAVDLPTSSRNARTVPVRIEF